MEPLPAGPKEPLAPAPMPGVTDPPCRFKSAATGPTAPFAPNVAPFTY